jgi:hypothetical protein
VDDDPGDLGAYCRAIEAYLCRRNDGHLVRVVGPAFDCVAGWAATGVPVRVAYRGIDRCVERFQAKGPRRRPLRVEFCDADVRDVFDEWRRAVGISAAHVPTGEGDDLPTARRHASLAAHLDRVVARLTILRGSGGLALGDVVDPLVAEIDAAKTGAKGLRGEPRRQLVERLRVLDALLIDGVRARVDAATLSALAAEADAELHAFRDRMPAEAYAAARSACVDRLLRDRYALPVVALE